VMDYLFAVYRVSPCIGDHAPLEFYFLIVTAFDYYSQSPIESLDRSYADGDRQKLATNYSGSKITAGGAPLP